MRVADAYIQFQTPKNLQEHMLRVGAFARILIDNWTGKKLDARAIVLGCLLHDIAKPMTFDLAKQAQFGMSPEAISRLELLQNDLKDRYGDVEHEATLHIMRELGCCEAAVRIVDNLEWKYLPRLLKENAHESLVAVYADMRIGPHGVVSLDERLADLKSRCGDDDYEKHARNGRVCEDVLASMISFDIATVSNAQIQERFEELLNTEI